MSGKVFINYRRGDDPGFTQALYQRLEEVLGPDRLFMDVEGHIKPGDDFVRVLDQQVAASDVVLAVVGPRWTELLQARGGAQDDFVFVELASAIERGKRVIPVLVGGAAMPKADVLPAGIESFARRNAVGLRPERFKADCQGLLTALEQQLAEAANERQARSEAERQAAEEARRRREAEEAARAKAAEERARAQAAQGLSPEEIRKAEELASWEYVRARGDEADVRDHLARFPSGITERNAMAKLDGLMWAGLGAEPTIASLRQYLAAFPKGDHAVTAYERITAREKLDAEARAAAQKRTAETAAWGAVAASTDKAKIEAFLTAWPEGEHAAAAKARLRELTYGALGKRVAAVPPAVSLSVIALALWLIGFVLTNVAELTNLGVLVVLAPALSAALVGLSLHLFTGAPASQSLWAGAAAAGLSLLGVTVLRALGLMLHLPYLLLGLTLAVLAAAAIMSPRARQWPIISVTIGVAGSTGFLERYTEEPADLYLNLLPASVIWAVGLGLMLSRAEKAGVNGSLKTKPADSVAVKAAPASPAGVATSALAASQAVAAPQPSLMRRIGRVLAWLVYGLVSAAAAFGVTVGLAQLGLQSNWNLEVRVTLAFAAGAATLIIAVLLARRWIRRSRAAMPAAVPLPQKSSPVPQ